MLSSQNQILRGKQASPAIKEACCWSDTEPATLPLPVQGLAGQDMIGMQLHGHKAALWYSAVLDIFIEVI